MALFEKNSDSKKKYLALLDANGDLIAIINPMNKVPMTLLMDSLIAKGLTVEIRESQPDVSTLVL